MSDDTLPKGILEAMALFTWRPHDDEAAAYARALEVAKKLPPPTERNAVPAQPHNGSPSPAGHG
jgi:hypothetical protein